MTSNQHPKQNRLSIPMTGIEVMKDLFLAANQMFHLVREGVLLPCDPKDLFRLNLEMNSIYDSPETTLSRWTYQKSDVEEFKLSHKDYWEELRQQKANANDHPQMTALILPQSGTNLGDKIRKGKFEGDNPPNVTEYISQRRREGVKEEVLAVELHDSKGHFKLSYADVARELNLTEGLNKDQHDAIKQRGKRICDKGKTIMQKQ